MRNSRWPVASSDADFAPYLAGEPARRRGSRLGQYGAMREQRLVFGEVAELYDSARAGYPDALIDDVLSFAGAGGPGLRAVEVGAGTGKATVSFAARGLEIVAIEPSAAMAAVARRKTAKFPGVSVEETSFEEWQAPGAAFRLLYSAQAWHWVTPDVRDVKAAGVLAPGGAIALFGHRVHWQGEPLRDELEDLYQRLAPDLLAQRPSFPGLIADPERGSFDAEILRTGLFRDVTTRTYRWSATFTADTYASLLQTQSGHRMLAQDRRARLLEGVRDIIAAHDGEIEIPHGTLLVMARRCGEPPGSLKAQS
jgi:ubiquinone/menaquinone biosynthesis C-methylase UbiE